MRARAAWFFLSLGVLAIGASRLLPGDTSPLLVLDAVGAAAAVAIVVGVRRWRPHDPRAWHFIALGVGLLVAGDVVWDVLSLPSQHDSVAETAANVCYLAAYPALALGLLRLVRARTDHGDRDALADSAIIVAAALLPAWQFLIEPAIKASPVSFDTTAAIVYPLLDLLLIGTVARVFFGKRAPSVAIFLLLAGLVTTLFADVVYLHHLAGPAPAEWLDVVWPLSYLLIGASALHPSMRVLTEPAPRRRPVLARTRIALLASALVVGPAIVISEHFKHRSVDALVLGPVSVLVAVLVMLRLIRAAVEADRATHALRESEERFRSLVQHASDVIVVIAPDGRVQYVSPGIENMLGSPPDTYLETMMDDHLHPDDIERAYSTLGLTLGNPGRAFVLEVRLRDRDGGWRWVEVVATGRVAEPSVGGVVCNLRDVDDRKRSAALQDGEARVLDLIARSAPLSATLVELIETVERQLVGARCSIRLLDHRSGVMQGAVAPSLPPAYVRQLDRLVPVDSEARELPHTHAFSRAGTIDLTGSDRLAQTREIARQHGLRWCWMVPIVASDSERTLGTFAVYVDDDSPPSSADLALVERASALAAVAIDRADAEDRLEHQALHDPLTELPNRSLVLDRLAQAVRRLERNPHEVVAVLFADLDRFKVINDSLGHDAGDELLVAVGERLRETLRPDDTVARFGGDEFVIVCERITHAEEAQQLAERVSRALQRPFPLERGEVVVSVSIGIAATEKPTERPESLLRDADAAMYRAKERGGARYEMFDQTMHTKAVVRLLTERSLRSAIDHDELRVFFQPQVRIASRECVAVEALVRWEHAMRGTVLPVEFIPVAEETGLIVAIGEKVMGEACLEAERWQHSGPDGSPLGVSVNLSARQLLRADLCEWVEGLLHEHRLAPETLCLEVTESVLLDDVDVTVDALAGLKEIGVRLAIDDFGTGYSSLSYLKQFPFDELKIDAAFVAGLGQSSTDDAIVAAIIDMAHALGMVAAAEGVETEVQLRRLEELGCDLAQGFHLAMPEPVERLEGLAPVEVESESA